MKKNKFFFFSLLVLMAALGLVLAGCPTDGGGGSNNNNNNDGGGDIPAELLGKWTGSYTYGVSNSMDTTAEFKSDKTLAITLGGSPAGTYTVTKVSGGKVYIKSPNASGSDGNFKYSVSGNTLTVTEKSMNGNAMYADSYTKSQ